jgi:hypothetical protein
MAAGAEPDTTASPQAPSAAKGVFMRRIFPFLLATNVFIGGEKKKKPRQISPLFAPASTSVWSWCLLQKMLS